MTSGTRFYVIVALATVALASCSSEGDGMRAGPSANEDSEASDLFGLGEIASEARIAAWDIDVRPDGTGLPEGNGSVERGAAVYLARCAGCHGPTGVEGPNNRLVGTDGWEDFPMSFTVGNYWPYATTLYDYIRRAMPLDAPGSLSSDDTYSVIAWILHQNGIVPADAIIGAATLPQVEMPARDRFVPDDRLESDDVR